MLNQLPKPFFAMAPMDDVTDTVFRRLISSCAAPDLCFTEFVNVDGLMSPGRKRLLKKLDYSSDEPPLIAHIWGLDPDNFYAVANQIASGELADELGLTKNFAGIDINMGCPVKQVVKMGACSALMNNLQLAQDIIESTKRGAAGRLPVSVKTRLGFNRIDPDWSKFLLGRDLALLTIHLRTTKEMSRVPAHYEELTRIKHERDSLAPTTLLMANGDILTHAQGKNLAARYGLDGVMIGRGVFHDPFVFAANSPWEHVSANDKIKLFAKHLALFADWSDNPDKAVLRLNKYAKIYLNGFNGAKELREKIAVARSVRQMQAALSAFTAA